MDTRKQRVINSILHRQSVLVPWSINLTSSAEKRMKERYHCKDCFAFLENCIAREKYKKRTINAAGEEVDLFGVSWGHSPDGGDVGNIKKYQLPEPSFDGYSFPKPDALLADKVCSALESRTDDAFRLFSASMNFFERAWTLRGMEGILMDMLSEEAFTVEMMERLKQYHLDLLDLVLDRNFDGVIMLDDWGQQRGLIMGPALWRKYLKPVLKSVCEKIKSKGKFVFLHSCGDLREIMPDIIECGVDVYNTVQPEIYDIRLLKKEYGKDLTFYGAISLQQFLTTATQQEVRDETKRVLDTMYKDGGYILAPTHDATPDVPPENLVAIVEAAKEYAG